VLVAQAAFTEPPAPAAPSLSIRADAVGVRVLPRGAATKEIAVARPIAGASSRERASFATYSAGTGGELAAVVRGVTSASLASAARRAASAATIERIELFDGRVVITNAKIDASASITNARASANATLAPSTTITVDGAPRPIRVNDRIVIDGVGSLMINEQALVANAPTGDAQTGPRARIVAAIAHIRLAKAYAGLAAGSELVIGRVDAGVRQGKIREVAHPGTSTETTGGAGSSSGSGWQSQKGVPKPGTGTLPRRSSLVRGQAAGGPSGNLQGYVFPVLGTSNYTNDWGAARASTGIPHQGNDIFADEGTPLVAVADGELNRVGWNSIGGYRLWLRDSYGNTFYYAHLSAFSPLAIDGAQVKAGDVLGFVGHTGDAQYTPPHVHFEIHPGDGAATNPFPFLNAWRKGVAVALSLLATGQQEPAGSALLGFADISPNSGLSGDVLSSVPDTKARPIESEREPVPTDQSLRGAIDGPGTSGT
jgi:murein DD-endopeptidase MepM/ murein hydrolase activator NlpD